MSRLYSPEERGVPKRLIADTLRWCNKMRKMQGKAPLDKLPRGRVGDPESCPCGRATGLFVFTDYADRGTPDGWIEFSCALPQSVQRFVERFDKGK